jgi:hypothetical protein
LTRRHAAQTCSPPWQTSYSVELQSRCCRPQCKECESPAVEGPKSDCHLAWKYPDDAWVSIGCPHRRDTVVVVVVCEPSFDRFDEASFHSRCRSGIDFLAADAAITRYRIVSRTQGFFQSYFHSSLTWDESTYLAALRILRPFPKKSRFPNVELERVDSGCVISQE